MEDPKLLGLLEQFIKGADAAFAGVPQQLIDLIKQHLKGDSEQKNKELKSYIRDRLLDGTTSDESKVQDRYLLAFQAFMKDPEIIHHFDNKETLQKIDSVCAVSNAINKTERKSFAHAHLTNLLSFFLCSKVGAPDFAAINPQLTKLLTDSKNSYNLAAFLASLRQVCTGTLSKAETSKVQQLLEGLLSHHKPSCETFHQASLWLEAQNTLKTFKLTIDSGKFEVLETALSGTVTAKGIGRLFDAVVLNDAVNTSSECGFFESVVVNIGLRNSDKMLLKLLKSLHNIYDAINKDKAQRQKKAFHLVSFMKSVFHHTPIATLLDIDLEAVLTKRQSAASIVGETANIESEAGNSVGEIVYDLINFWQSQIGNKNIESRTIAVEFDHQLAKIVKGVLEQQGVEHAAKLVLALLKILKHSPSNQLRGGDLEFMHAALCILYRHEKSFHAYLAYLTAKLKLCTRVAALNFYLNELEHLGQVALGAKAHKSAVAHSATTASSQPNSETNMRLEVVKVLIEVFGSCQDEKSLGETCSQGGTLDWNDQELSFKKFRLKAFERVLNLVFKRDDSTLLLQAAEQFAKVAARSAEGQAEFFNSTFQAGKKLLKKNPEYGALVLGLVFQNFFEDDAEKNSDIVSDLIKAAQLMIENASHGAAPVKKLKTSSGADSLVAHDGLANGQSPQDVFVDSMIALCSTSIAQLKPLINKAFETAAVHVTKVGLSLLFQAVTRPDSKYLMEEESLDEDEAIDGEEEASEGELDQGEEEEGVDEDEEEEQVPVNPTLGKRQQPATNGARGPSGNKLNGTTAQPPGLPNLKAKVKA